MFKTLVIESNSNSQFVNAAFKLLKEKIMSRIMIFTKYISLNINLTEKLNFSFFSPHKYYFDLKLHKSLHSLRFQHILVNFFWGES